MTEYITYRYRIYPTKAQTQKIENAIEGCRALYNVLLLDKICQYETTGQVEVFKAKDYLWDFPQLKLVDPLSLSETQLTLDRAFAACDLPNGKYPPERPPHPKGSYVAPRVKLDGNRLILPRVGAVRLVKHRLPPAGDILRATIIRTASGRYYAALLYSQNTRRPFIPISDERTIGLDFSVPKFYVDSCGNSPDHPRFYEQEETHIEAIRRKMRRMTYGSNNYKKERRKLSRLYEKIRNRRMDWLHKESRRLATEYDTVVTETLDLQSIAQTFKLYKRTLDNAYGTFQTMLKYKLERQDKHFYKLNPYLPSSQICSYCGHRNRDLPLSARFWTCPHCGRLIPRDHNAAINIKERITRLHQ